MMQLVIRTMQHEDVGGLAGVFASWNKTAEQYIRYYAENQAGQRVTFVAFVDGRIAGYCNVEWQSNYGPFLENDIPEITDLNVLAEYRNQGIGRRLIGACEDTIMDTGRLVAGIGVGMTPDYAVAQHLYPTLGYIADGTGTHSTPWGDVTYFTKKIKARSLNRKSERKEAHMTSVKFGWHSPSFPVDGSSATTFAAQVRDILGRVQDPFDSVWVDDHFMPWAKWQSNDTPYVECVTTIAALAGEFPRIKFGSSVLCQSYRNPALTAKMAANLQWWTGGRFIFGIGAGWMEEDYRAYGYDFPRPAVRIAQLEETVEITKLLWTEPVANYSGKYYRVQDAYCEPKPDPLPPILIGGGGEQLTLRVVAKHADWWNIPGGDLNNYVHKLEVLKRHCDAVGRDYDSIVKTWAAESIALAPTEAEAKRISQASPFQNGAIVGTSEQVAGALRHFVDAGVTYFFVRLVDFPNPEGIEQFAEEVIPLFNKA